MPQFFASHRRRRRLRRRLHRHMAAPLKTALSTSTSTMPSWSAPTSGARVAAAPQQLCALRRVAAAQVIPVPLRSASACVKRSTSRMWESTVRDARPRMAVLHVCACETKRTLLTADGAMCVPWHVAYAVACSVLHALTRPATGATVCLLCCSQRSARSTRRPRGR